MTSLSKVSCSMYYFSFPYLYLICFLEIFLDPVSYCLIKESGNENWQTISKRNLIVLSISTHNHVSISNQTSSVSKCKTD